MPYKVSGYTVLLRNYFQYEIMRRELLKLFYRNALEKMKPVDCYIDLNSYLKYLYRNDHFIDDSMYIASSIINYCAYIREFFASRFDIPTRIFIVYGNNRPTDVATILPEYNAHNELERSARSDITNLIEENLKLVDILSPYIPEVYYIRDDTVEPAVLIRAMIAEQSKLDYRFPRVIFTRDMYSFQLAVTCPNTHIVRVKKTMQGDKSYTISFFDFYKKVYDNLKTNVGQGINPELYSLYMTLSGCKDRNIKSILTLPRADTTIRSMLDSGILLNGYNHSLGVSMDGFVKMNQSIPMDTDLANLLYNRYQALDLVTRTNYYNLSPNKSNLMRGYVNLYEPKTVRDINNQYFKIHPLDLNVL